MYNVRGPIWLLIMLRNENIIKSTSAMHCLAASVHPILEAHMHAYLCILMNWGTGRCDVVESHAHTHTLSARSAVSANHGHSYFAMRILRVCMLKWPSSRFRNQAVLFIFWVFLCVRAHKRRREFTFAVCGLMYSSSRSAKRQSGARKASQPQHREHIAATRMHSHAHIWKR